MRLEHYNQEKLKGEILGLIGRHLDLTDYKLFFFGSRTADKGDERSDIDVGIEGREPVPIGVMFDIQDELERLPTLYKVDVVDFHKTSKRFAQLAKQHIELIN